MIKTEKGYVFNCTGREALTYGVDGISLTDNNQVRVGYDDYLEILDIEEEEAHRNFTDEEKKELALFMIEKWKKFADLK